MTASLTTVVGACAFVHRDGSPARFTFDRTANPLLSAAVSDLELSSYCVEENKPIATVLSFEDCELIVIGVSHRNHTVIVAWHTPLFCDMLAIIQAQRYDSPDSLRNNLTAGIPMYNPKAPTRQVHLYANYPLSPLVRSFGYEGLRLLLSLASSGKTIVFIGETLSTPSLCCFGLRAALQPLDWLGLFAPVCDPYGISETIFTEVAMVGTHSSAVPSLLLSNKKEAFIANCATGVIAPTAPSTVVYTFPPSEKLKTALGEGSDMVEGVFNYWATHCIGQYRKGLAGKSFDPFKCLFPTTAGSSRERLARNISSSPAFARWLRFTVENEKKAPFTDYCARQFPDLYPEYHKSKPSSLGLGLFTKAKQTIRSMTTDVDVRLAQYMTNPHIFGSYLQSSSDQSPFFGVSNGESRLPLDCLVNFDAYHLLLTPVPSRRAIVQSTTGTTSAIPQTSADTTTSNGSKMPAPPHSPPRRTGMSMIKDGPPKTFTIVESPDAAPAIAASENAPGIDTPQRPVRSPRQSEGAFSSTPAATAVIQQRTTSPIPEAHRALLDLSEIRLPPSPPPAANTNANTDVAPTDFLLSDEQRGDGGEGLHATNTAMPTSSSTQPTSVPAPNTGKYDAFAELEKLAATQQSTAVPQKEEPKKFNTLDDFF